MKSQLERDYARTDRKPPIKQCAVCGSREPFGADGKPTRYLALAEGKWACNYCNNQKPGA